MMDLDKGIKHKISEYENVLYNMDGLVFEDFLKKATDEQLALLDDILNDDVQIVFVNSKSGTGKTQLAVLSAYALFLKKKKEMLYIVSPVEEDKMGFTKGDLKEKESKYMTPLHDALETMGQLPEYAIKDDRLIEEQKDKEVWCETKTHVFVRGSNIVNKTLIIEEAQNFTTNDLQKVLTRVHDNTKVIVIGHDGQIDLKHKGKSGFTRYIEHFEKYPRARKHDLHRNFRGDLSQFADLIEYDKK